MCDSSAHKLLILCGQSSDQEGDLVLQTGTFTYQKFAEILSDPEVSVSCNPAHPLPFRVHGRAMQPAPSFRLQVCRQMGLKSSKKLHTTNNSCYCLGNLALTLCLKFSKVQAWVIPLSVQVEITFQTSSAGGKHSKFLKACLNITVGSFQKQPREVIIILENVGISLCVTVHPPSKFTRLRMFIRWWGIE